MRDRYNPHDDYDYDYGYGYGYENPAAASTSEQRVEAFVEYCRKLAALAANSPESISQAVDEAKSGVSREDVKDLMVKSGYKKVFKDVQPLALPSDLIYENCIVSVVTAEDEHPIGPLAPELALEADTVSTTPLSFAVLVRDSTLVSRLKAKATQSMLRAQRARGARRATRIARAEAAKQKANAIVSSNEIVQLASRMKDTELSLAIKQLERERISISTAKADEKVAKWVARRERLRMQAEDMAVSLRSDTINRMINKIAKIEEKAKNERRELTTAEKKEVRAVLLFNAFTLTVAIPNAFLSVRFDTRGFYAAMRPYLEHPAKPDDVVYRYAGTNDTPAGASARDMYVAKLRPDQLRKEGFDLGICVGDPDYNYAERVEAGDTEIYSIRTEARKPKFSIERGLVRRTRRRADGTKPAAVWTFEQVKGKANRLPGFLPPREDDDYDDDDDNDVVLAKPDEVRLVCEFLLALGYAPAEIEGMIDIEAGVKAMLENGINPFVPPPKTGRAAAIEAAAAAENPPLVVSPAVAAIARADYARPWGGVWGTGLDDDDDVYRIDEGEE